ncbi:DUF2272 domain-containing protein [Chromatium okenii]|uniref:DUF2272 domain-containing protein n=1 Tax=Chromatium okenii TaxID=61644 RepID=UPI0026F30E17|nr:DUF2272 domain-containing protein [Chromatium okenii]
MVSQYDAPTTMMSLLYNRLRFAVLGAVCLALFACATPPERSGSDSGRNKNGSWAGVPIGAPPTPNSRVKQAILSRAHREWEFFGRQTVVLKGGEESIPHVGAWEDDSDRHSDRVNVYWRIVKEPQLTGMDCNKPWSAAFISWIMQAAGVPTTQFPLAEAHSTYIASIIANASEPRRWFVPRRISDYSPKPGDLICASRGKARPRFVNGYISASSLQGMSGHCDLVVGASARSLEVIGGNVRNSVSKTTLELNNKGRLLPSAKRPWFVVVENRL